MKRILLAVLLGLCALALCSCTAATMERQTFALCLGVDTDQENQITLSVQTPMNGSGSGGNTETPEYTVFSATGKDFDEAFALLAASTPCPINFSQLRLCVISYELAARTELRPLLTKLSQLSSMRPAAYVMITLGNAQEVLKAQKPDFGMRMSTHLSLYTKRLYNEKIMPDAALSLCVRELGAGRMDPLLAVCAVNPALKPKEDSGGQSGAAGGGAGGDTGGGAAAAFSEGEPWTRELLPESMMAGMLPRTGNDPVEYLGSATVGNGRVSGALSAEETQIVLRTKQLAKLEVITEDGGIRLQIWLPKAESERQGLEEKNVLQVMRKLQALHCDALGFGGAAARGMMGDAEWAALDMESKYPTAEVYVGMR